jgi:hypothetical protein
MCVCMAICVDRNAWIRAPESRRFCGQRERKGCGINTGLKVGVDKLVNLRPRTTASRIACRVETYRDSAGVADDIGKNRLFLRAHAF